MADLFQDADNDRTPLHIPAGSSAGIPSLTGYDSLVEIGRGGQSVVYRGFNQALQRCEAIKVMRSGASAHELERFRVEAKVMASFDHPNILPVYKTEEHAGQALIVTPYIAGGSLFSRLKEFQGNYRVIALLMSRIARAVHHAHQHGILHRDLKPANILLDKNSDGSPLDSHPLVADFGLARRLDQSTVQASGPALGTLQYMAPEQVEGTLSVAVDVHGLGAILYALLTGGPPFTGNSIPDILNKIVTQEPVEPHRHDPSVDRDLEAVCLCCLRKQPQTRYPSALALAEDLESYLRGTGVSVRPPGVWDWMRHAWQRKPAVAEYTWQVPGLIGLTQLASHGIVFGLIRAKSDMASVWIPWIVGQLLIAGIIWFGSLAKFRQVPVVQHAAAMVGVAYWLANWAAMIGQAPISLSDPATNALPAYPTLCLVGGMTSFTLGVVFWGREFASGLLLLALAFVVGRTGEFAPLIQGFAVAAALCWWSISIRLWFVPREQSSSRVATSR